MRVESRSPTGDRSAAEGPPTDVVRLAAGRWHGMPTAVLAFGVASLALMIGGNWIQDRLISEDVRRVQALEAIQTELAISHLWVEEYVAGDQVPVETIWSRLDNAISLVTAVLEGEQQVTAGSPVPRFDDPHLRREALALLSEVEQFREISHQRYDGYGRGEEIGIGSEIDTRYDRLFIILLDRAQAIQEVVETRLGRNARAARWLFLLVVIAWIVIVAVAVTGLWNRERRRQRAEAQLRDSQAQLLQAQKMEAVGRLAGGVAHDINNYLGAITGQCELVKMKSESGSATDQSMDTAIGTAMKASTLIKQLLAFSRRQPAQLQVVSLNEVVEGLGPMLDRLLGEDVQLELQLAAGLWNVRIDPSQAEQILVNLLVNAREAMPTGGLVTVETRNCQRSGLPRGSRLAAAEGCVALIVTDSGPGIPQELRDTVFEPFFTTKREQGSSGLGLATVYGIVEQSAGVIEVDNAPGRGARFALYLPRTLEEGTGLSRGAAAVAPAGGSERVLLVEDHADLRVSTQAVLEVLGYRVTAAADGIQALAACEALGDEVALVITDVVMPGMSGRELADRLGERNSRLRVLFVSGYTDDVILRHGVADGEVDFLQKPFSARQLARKVREVLDRRA